MTETHLKFSEDGKEVVILFSNGYKSGNFPTKIDALSAIMHFEELGQLTYEEAVKMIVRVGDSSLSIISEEDREIEGDISQEDFVYFISVLFKGLKDLREIKNGQAQISNKLFEMSDFISKKN